MQDGGGEGAPLTALSFEGQTSLRFGRDGLFLSRSGAEHRVPAAWDEPPVRCLLSADGRRVIGQLAREVVCWDDQGRLLWTHHPGGAVRGVSLCRDGHHVAVVAAVPAEPPRGLVRVLDPAGQRVASLDLDRAPSAVDGAGGGRFLLAVWPDGVGLFDEGTAVWREAEEGPPVAAVSAHGRLVALAGAGGVRLYENRLVALPGALAQAVRRVRRAYVANPTLGLGTWLQEFDDRIGCGHLDVCDGMLDELYDPAYDLCPADRDAVESRRAALLLRRGLDHHRRGDFRSAWACYGRARRNLPPGRLRRRQLPGPRRTGDARRGARTGGARARLEESLRVPVFPPGTPRG